jgi:hypothetical protein
MLEKFSTPEDRTTAASYIETLRSRDFDAFRASLDPSVKVSQSSFRQAAKILSSERPQQIQLVGFRKFTSDNETDVDAVYQMRFRNWWTVAEVNFKWVAHRSFLLGLHVQRFGKSLQELNAFTLVGKDAIEYVWLLAAVLAGFVSIVTLFLCALTPNLKWKWLWLAAIAIGVVEFSINWTTGDWAIAPISIHVPVAGATIASPYAPWMLYFTLPIGVIVFWFVRLRAKTRQAAGER